MHKYRLFLVRVFTTRWEESFQFYRDVIGFPVAYSDPDSGWAQFELGASEIALERCDPGDDESDALVGRFVGISIEVDDINSVYDELVSKGVEFIGEPEVQPWGGTLAHFKDVDGNILTLFGS